MWISCNKMKFVPWSLHMHLLFLCAITTVDALTKRAITDTKIVKQKHEQRKGNIGANVLQRILNVRAEKLVSSLSHRQYDILAQ